MTNQTPTDNYHEAEERQVPQQMTRKTITLAGTGAGSVALGRDVKTCTVYCTDAVYLNVSYDDGATDSPGDLVTAASNEKVLRHPGGGSFVIAQNTEFNKVFAKGVASSTDTIEIYPGGGLTA
jgi:hypothetical protein